MKLRQLPQSTPYDPAEDPPGSVDPLGTVTGAEQLAEVLLPGLTARMWRVRLLTFAALAAEVSKRVAAGREDRYMDARLAFERLFVSAIARQDEGDPAWRKASRRLPGIGLARQAWRAGDRPLERANFLKGQGVNGPFGVISRLARDVGVVDESGELQRAGTSLLLAWAEDQGLPGLLDDPETNRIEDGRDGAKWLRKLVRQVSLSVDESHVWPGKHWPSWDDLAERLRLDQPGTRERNVIKKLLACDPLGLRDRVIDCLADSKVVDLYREANASSYRGEVEKQVIVNGLGAKADDEIGRTVQASIKLIDAYEVLSGLLESVFRGLVWGLTRNNGQASRSAVVADSTLRSFLAKVHSKIGPAALRFQRQLQVFEMDSLAGKRGSVDVDRMHALLEDALAASPDADVCVSAVMARHVRVQKEKNKGVWIEVDNQWTLMPGFGDTAEEPFRYEGYLHAYRVTNIYGMLADLRVVPEIRAKDAEEENE